MRLPGPSARNSGRHARALGPRSWALSLVIAAALGLLLAISTLSLPYLMSSPASDPHFGALNQCLTQVSQGPRLGWAVAPDASRAATFGARGVTLCGKQGPATLFSTLGVTAITFDGGNRLWVATGEQLLHEEAGQLSPVGDFAPVALAGHAAGVIAMDAQGQLLSISPQGGVLGQAKLPTTGTLSVGPEGKLAAVLVGGGVVAYEAGTLSLLRAEAPCQVEELWWLEAPAQVLLACGPGPGRALTLDLKTGQQAQKEHHPKAPARRLSGLALYVQGCDGLPCTAPAPE